jgi:hypothetical protein
MYTSNPFAHWALEEGCQHHAPATLPQERAPVTVVQEAGWTPEMVLHGVRFPDRPAGSLSLQDACSTHSLPSACHPNEEPRSHI